MKIAQLKIDGMHCQACVRRVSTAVEKVDGVQTAKVDIGSASIEFDPAKTSEQAIGDAIRAVGFELPAGETP